MTKRRRLGHEAPSTPLFQDYTIQNWTLDIWALRLHLFRPEGDEIQAQESVETGDLDFRRRGKRRAHLNDIARCTHGVKY